MADQNHDRWVDLLDRLEDDVAIAMCALDDPSAPPAHTELWAPPTDMGPLPEDLLPRASLLQRAQKSVRDRQAQALESVRQQLGAVQSVPKDAGNNGAVYLNVTG